MALRTPPSGPFTNGNNVGDVLTWDGTDWVAAALGAVGAFDHALASRADLVAVVAPVAGVFNLPSGSYAVTAPIALNAGEQLVVPNGNSVLLMCMGPTKVVSSDPGGNPLLLAEAGSELDLITPYLNAQGAGNVALSSAGTVRCVGGQISGSGNATAALRVTAGQFDATGTLFTAGASSSTFFNANGDSDGAARFRGCRFTGAQAFGVVAEMGRLLLEQCYLEGGTSAALTVTGLDPQTVELRQCVLRSGPTTVLHQGAVAHLALIDCDIAPNDNNADCVLVNGVPGCCIRGGYLHSLAGTPGAGVNVSGNVTEDLRVVGVRGTDLGVLVARSGGTQSRALVAHCDADGSVGVGVDWASASIPTLGLLELGNAFDVSSIPYNGHNQATARVNRKGNLQSSGLSSETAIVP